MNYKRWFITIFIIIFVLSTILLISHEISMQKKNNIKTQVKTTKKRIDNGTWLLSTKEVTTIQFKEKETKKHYVYIIYYSNKGKFIHNNIFNSSSKGIIQKKNKVYITKVAYNEKITKKGLADYNSRKGINLSKNHYYVPLGEEWNTNEDGSGKSYSQDKIYSSDDFCDASKKDCIVSLYVNWKKCSSKPYSLGTLKFDQIDLDNRIKYQNNQGFIVESIRKKTNNNDHIDFAQGFTKADDYFIFCSQREKIKSPRSTLIVYKNNNGKMVRVEGLKLDGIQAYHENFGHCNDLTYNPDEGKIYVAPSNGDIINKAMSLTDLASGDSQVQVEDADFRNTEGKIIYSSGIAYDKEQKQYYLAKGSTLYVLDINKRLKNAFVKIATDVPQGIEAYDGRILVIRYRGSKAPVNDNIDETKNIIDIYRSTGDYLGSYIIDYPGELESLSYAGDNTFYVNTVDDANSNGVLYKLTMPIPY